MTPRIVERICPFCEKSFQAIPHVRTKIVPVYCSKECRTNMNNWKWLVKEKGKQKGIKGASRIAPNAHSGPLGASKAKKQDKGQGKPAKAQKTHLSHK